MQGIPPIVGTSGISGQRGERGARVGHGVRDAIARELVGFFTAVALGQRCGVGSRYREDGDRRRRGNGDRKSTGKDQSSY